MSAVSRFRWSGFLVRWLFVYGLVVATYNPSGYSFVDWLFNGHLEYLAVKVFVGITLVLLFGFIGMMALRALRLPGLVLAGMLSGTLTWALESQGLMPETRLALVLFIEAQIAATLAAGLSLVLLRQWVTGQMTTAEGDML